MMLNKSIEKKDLMDMVEVITLAVVHLQTEEHFFQRSADGSTNESAKMLFNEIAQEIGRCRKSLEDKHQMLMRILISAESFRE
jgi:hypothetical protein